VILLPLPASFYQVLLIVAVSPPVSPPCLGGGRRRLGTHSFFLYPLSLGEERERESRVPPLRPFVVCSRSFDLLQIPFPKPAERVSGRGPRQTIANVYQGARAPPARVGTSVPWILSSVPPAK
jgi:hypothetical protein